MHTRPARLDHRWRRFGWFLALSVLLHGLLAIPFGHPLAALPLPAPELVVTYLDGRSADARAPHATPATDTTTATSTSTPADRLTDTRDPAGVDRARANHLHSLLRVALDRHFVYPPFARRNGWQGRVELLVRLDGAGRVDAVRILRSSGHAVLDQDALLTLRRISTVPEARSWLQGYSGYDLQLPVHYRLTES